MSATGVAEGRRCPTRWSSATVHWGSASATAWACRNRGRPLSSSIPRPEEPTLELQPLMPHPYAVFCLKKNITQNTTTHHRHQYSHCTTHNTPHTPLNPPPI